MTVSSFAVLLIAASRSNVSIIAIAGIAIVVIGLILLVLTRRRKAKQDAVYFGSYDVTTAIAPPDRPDMERVDFTKASVGPEPEVAVQRPQAPPAPPLETPPLQQPPSEMDDAAEALAELDRLLGKSD